MEEKRKLLNIRRMYVPDSGEVFVDADLAGADAMVYAWQLGEYGPSKFKEYMRTGVKIHVDSNRFMFPKLCGEDGKGEPYYTEVKSAGFAVNYGGYPPTISENLGWTYKQADGFRRWWLQRFPEIPHHHQAVEEQIQRTREVSTKFGYRIHFFEDIRGLLSEALAWVPQATVANVTGKAALLVRKNIPRKYVKIALQVHDSLVFRIPRRELNVLHEVREHLNSIIIPFDDPLKIPWNFKWSMRSWGHIQPIKSWDKLEIGS